MSWKERLLVHLGPGYFSGITLGDWLALLFDNHFSVSPARVIRAASTTIQSIPNSFARLAEEVRYKSKIESTTIQPPLFILGHYRQGTTHLHNLLSIDQRFAYPNAYQATYPHTFLTTENLGAKIGGLFLPRSRIQDNVRLAFDVPYEDEIAMVTATKVSPYLALVFPQRTQHYDRFLSFQEATEEEIRQWRDGLLLFLKKLTFKYDKPLLLKSPPHTCRIRLLLEMFPEAKFVHIKRNPYEVFQSTLRTIDIAHRWTGLQSDNCVDWVERTICQYKKMYDVFFVERDLIPHGRFYEVSFEELENQPIEEVRNIYNSLSLPDFATVEPDLRQYVQSISSYRKNEFSTMTEELRERLRKEWHRCFEEWGY